MTLIASCALNSLLYPHARIIICLQSLFAFVYSQMVPNIIGFFSVELLIDCCPSISIDVLLQLPWIEALRLDIDL